MKYGFLKIGGLIFFSAQLPWKLVWEVIADMSLWRSPQVPQQKTKADAWEAQRKVRFVDSGESDVLQVLVLH